MKRIELKLILAGLAAIACLIFLLTGCQESEQTVAGPKLRDQLLSLDNTEAGRQWKEAFGDNIETAQGFNLFLLNDAYSRFNKRITALEAKDPNE